MLRALVLLCLLGWPLRAEQTELVLVGGTIYTGNERQPKAETVRILDGRIVAVGARSELTAEPGKRVQVINLRGRTVFPGFSDSHVHLAGIGFRELAFDLEGTSGVADLQAKLRTRAQQAPRGQWITGRGWIETHWTPAVFPTARDLDAITPDHPVALTRADGHALVANALALKLAGIDRTTPDPKGGKILRDPKTGEATGMLVDNAMTLVRRLLPQPTEAETVEALTLGARREASLGWTGLQIAGHSHEEAELVRRLVAEGKIRLRILDAVSGPGPAANRLLQDGPILGETDGRYTRRGIKLFADGALGSRGAALLKPYADAPDSQGLLLLDEATVKPLLFSALRRGLQIETHAIGDRANRLVLDWYEHAFAAVPKAERPVPEPRWRIEHTQVVSPSDLPRLAKLGVIASMQPSHAIGDLYFAPSRLGKERLKGAYAWQSLWQTGAVVTFGSDAPVERGEPLVEFFAAVARKSVDGFANEDWHLEERLTRAQALRALTLNPAYAAFEEKDRGTIEVGKRADFTVFSADLMTIPEDEILRARCVMTIVGGEIIYQEHAP